MNITLTPPPPYYAVIFTSKLSNSTEGYEEMAREMIEGCKNSPGFLGVDSARSEIGITVCYWKDLESIELWKNNIRHQHAQKMGKEQWYTNYITRIAKVEKSSEF